MRKFELRIKRGEAGLVPPAKETPKILYYLPDLDLIQNFYAHHLFCYNSQHRGNEEAAKTISESLANVLVHYYPLAGRFAVNNEGKLVVNCNAEGAMFVEAEADCVLDDIGDIRNANPLQLVKLVYYISEADGLFHKPLLAAQITKLKCGGFILGLTLNHSMVDGYCVMQFMVSWCETARGLPLSVPPFLDRAIMHTRDPPDVRFPHCEFMKPEDISGTTALYQQEEMVQRSFLFEQMKLERIKKKAMEDGSIGKCTTFEALSGFIWTAQTAALNLLHDQDTKIDVTVDCRKFFSPPLAKGYFGNVIWSAIAFTTAGELLRKPLSFAVGLVQNAVKGMNYDYLRSAIDYMGIERPKALPATLIISTLGRMSYDIRDFGWGAPVQFGPVFLKPKELVMFMPHGKDNENMEVLVALPSSAMKKFEELMDDDEAMSQSSRFSVANIRAKI